MVSLSSSTTTTPLLLFSTPEEMTRKRKYTERYDEPKESIPEDRAGQKRVVADSSGPAPQRRGTTFKKKSATRSGLF